MKNARLWPLFALGLVHGAALFADFLAPYAPDEQHRANAWNAPAELRFELHRGWPRLLAHNQADGHWYRVQFLTRNAANRQVLFSTHSPGHLFLLGTDAFGRDQFSRLLHGARISLFSGLLAASIALTLGVCFGVLGGYFGGWLDTAVSFLIELFLALPWLYFLLAARVLFPLEASPRVVFFALIALLGALGWARPARLIRGIVLTVKEREFVLAARGCGASDWYLLRSHILPEALPVLGVTASLLIPQYVLAEATLSFLGLGIGEPSPSWGALLAAFLRLHVLTSYWWMTLPVLIFGCVFALYHVLSLNLRRL